MFFVTHVARRTSHFARNNSGLTLIELIVTVAILSVLGMLVLPMAQTTAKRAKETELRRELRIIRTALDEYKKTYEKAVDEKKIQPGLTEDMPASGYPATLKTLVDGVDFGGLYKEKKKFLRRIPVDPFNPPKPSEEPKWALRSYADEPDSTAWGGEDVYDVHSLNAETAIDGTKYNEW